LVHVVDDIEINNAEEEELGAESYLAETFTLHINLFFGNF
jgi:hypothetical protein